jgi:hypothetical protein
MTFDYNEWLASIRRGEPSKVLELSQEAKEWLAIRQEEALRIDPNTAEASADYGRYSDPYNLYPAMPKWAGDRRDRRNLRVLDFVRRADGDVWIWEGCLSDDVRAALLDRFDQVPIHLVKNIAAATRPIRFFRRCSTMSGGQIVNDDRPRRPAEPLPKGEELCAIVRQEALKIDLHSIDVCRSRGFGHPYRVEEFRGYYDLLFYRRRGSGVWVAETYLPDPLRAALRERIASRRIKVLWKYQCDD